MVHDQYENKFCNVVECQVCTKSEEEINDKTKWNKINPKHKTWWNQSLWSPNKRLQHNMKGNYHRLDPCSHYKKRGFFPYLQSQLQFYVTAVSVPFFARLSAQELVMFLHCSLIHWSYSRGLLLWSPQNLTLCLWNLASKDTEIHTKPQLKADLIWPVYYNYNQR